MGLNLSFEETPNYHKIANCSELKNGIGEYVLCITDKSKPPSWAIDQDHRFYENEDGTYITYTFKADDITDDFVEKLKSLGPIVNEDYDSELAVHIRTRNKWYGSGDLSENWKSHCSNCKLCPNENFQGCHPRMGSYGYVASLQDFVEEHSSIDENVAKLISNPFVISTSPGGYRIEQGEEFGGVENYSKQLEAIAQCRDVLVKAETHVAHLCKDGEIIEGYYYPSSPALDSMGSYSWFRSGSGLGWGAHAFRGIAMITGNRFRGEKESVVYLKSIKGTPGEDAIGITFSGDEITIPSGKSPITKPNFKDEKGYDEMRWGTAPALDRFEHLLDTAETALKLAIEHDLVVLEC